MCHVWKEYKRHVANIWKKSYKEAKPDAKESTHIKRWREVSLCQGTSFRYTGSKFSTYREKAEDINMPRKASIQQKIRIGEAKSPSNKCDRKKC